MHLFSMRVTRKNAVTLTLIVVMVGGMIYSVGSLFFGNKAVKVTVVMETSMGTIEL